MLTRRRLVVSLALTPLAGYSFAADWPNRSVRILYPYAAGSVGDAAARLIAQRLSEVFSQAFIVENRVGANGIIAAEAVARAPADGYTLFWATTPQFSISPALTKVPYDPIGDFAPVSAAITNTFALVVNAQMPVQSVAEFVAYVRARPDLNYAEGGVGSINHLAMALFLQRAGLRMTNINYKGNAPALNDVIAGRVPAMFSILGDALPHARSGIVRLLAVTSMARSSEVPDVPTVAESGYPGYTAISWNGVVAPAKTPQPIIDRIALEVGRAVRDPTIADRLIRLGLEPLGNSPAEFAAMISADMALWSDAVRITGVKLE